MVVARASVYLRFVGANVHRLRVKQAMTQEMLEEATGLDLRFLRRVERGSVNLRFDTLIRLADALRCEPAVLLRRATPLPVKQGRPRGRTTSPQKARGR